MDLIYKIYSVWLYDNQLDHDFIILYNRKMNYTKKLCWDIPYDYSDSLNEIFKLKSDPNLESKSIEIIKLAEIKSNRTMISSLKKESLLVKNDEFLSLIPCGESRISYSGIGDGDPIKEGKYKGLYKKVYTPYDIYWNETKSGINIQDWEVAGIWNVGSSFYSSYRIWEEKSERKKEILNNKLNQLLS